MGKSKSPAPTPAPAPTVTKVETPGETIQRPAASAAAVDRAATNKSADLLAPAQEDTKTGMGGSAGMLS
jgi:hypothetical protein